MKDGILATVCNQLLAFRCENLSVDTGAALLPYRLKSQTSTIAAKLYAPPLVDDGNDPGLSALRLGPSAPYAAVHLLPDGSSASDRDAFPVIRMTETGTDSVLPQP